VVASTDSVETAFDTATTLREATAERAQPGAEGKAVQTYRPATCGTELLDITKAAVQPDSFSSALPFRETTFISKAAVQPDRFHTGDYTKQGDGLVVGPPVRHDAPRSPGIAATPNYRVRRCSRSQRAPRRAAPGPVRRHPQLRPRGGAERPGLLAVAGRGRLAELPGPLDADAGDVRHAAAGHHHGGGAVGQRREPSL
jgi:hypothetical protein